MEQNMIVKFETKSNRVKGLSFHPSRPWILASLHIGIVQLWDYRMGTLLERFEDHEGPVRGVCFHPTQPLFVSGGDDYTLRVWNYKMRRCLFVLTGHMDYVRTVQFHHESPWVLSASDDQTIRIWNWQSRTCVSLLTGHSHYVMCASFHPKSDLIVSASLDQTVRVWDISGLRAKSGPRSIGDSGSGGGGMGGGGSGSNDLFGMQDAAVKYVLEGHDRGVNWASFHPTLPLILSGADDRTIKLWRHNESKAWEVDKFHGHFANVSCVLFHPRPGQDVFVSNSEDKSIRVWDIQRRTCIHTWRRENDRYWMLAAHPTANLFAAGHDSGLVVFKLERERPGFASHKNLLYFVKDRYVRAYDYSTGRDQPVLPVRRTGGTTPPRSMAFNPAEKAVLLTWDDSGGSYELYQLPTDSSRLEVDCWRGACLGAVFVARNKFAVLDPSHKIQVRSLTNEVTKRCNPPHPGTDGIFYAGTGCVLLRSEERITLFDIQRRAGIRDIVAPKVKYVVWSKDMQLVALLSKHAIVICTRKLKQLGVVHETIRVKSAAWDDSGVLIFSTLNHLKYALPNGDAGIIRTLEVPVYITRVAGNQVVCLDREIKTRTIAIDSTEYLFKVALLNGDHATVREIIKSAKLIGKSIVSYLQKKGFPDVALHFVRDPRTRFSLAIESGNIDIALECATAVDESDMWQQLAAEALRQGNHQIVEMAYQRTKSFAKLSFLYVITGNRVKLGKMLQIATKRADAMSRAHNSLYLGEVESRIALLRETGQLQLAYACAVTHGKTAEADDILRQLGPDRAPPPGFEASLAKAELLQPPVPLLRAQDASNWPLLNKTKGYFDSTPTDRGASSGIRLAAGEDDEELVIPDGGWASDEDAAAPVDAAGGAGDAGGKPSNGGDADAEGGWSDTELELPPEVSTPAGGGGGGAAGAGGFVAAAVGQPDDYYWTSSATTVAEHVAAGSFEAALYMLDRQIGLGNAAPLKPLFMRLYAASRGSLTLAPGMPPFAASITRGFECTTGKASAPTNPLQMAGLVTRLQAAYKLTTGGKFPEALISFREILLAIPLVHATTQQEAVDAREMRAIGAQYVTGLELYLARKEAKDDVKRALELVAYFTHCRLEQQHARLALDAAMKAAYKAKNFVMAGSFARRLLDLAPPADVADMARKIVSACDKTPTNAEACNYDERNPFVVCCGSFTPIYAGSPQIKCSYCQVAYQPDFRNSTCRICSIGRVGAEGSGLPLSRK